VNSTQEMARQLQEHLERQGHQVRMALTVAAALPLLEARRPDLLIVECRQLAANGADLFRLLDRWPEPPLILPSSPHPTAEHLAPSLSAGFGSLEAAVSQARRLLAQREEQTLRVGDLVIDLSSKRVTLHGQQVMLPPIQFRLLAHLAENMGRVVGARELLKAVWGYEGDEAEARELVKVHVRQIRRRLGLQAQRADYVQAVRGFGYMVVPPENWGRVATDHPNDHG